MLSPLHENGFRHYDSCVITKADAEPESVVTDHSIADLCFSIFALGHCHSVTAVVCGHSFKIPIHLKKAVRPV